MRKICWVSASLLCCYFTLNAATITVTNTNDSGPGSLRAAVAAAASGDFIDCQPINHGNIFLTTGVIPIPVPIDIGFSGGATNTLFISAPSIFAITSNLTLTNNFSSLFQFNGVFSGPGSLTIEGTAVAQFRAPNTYTGGTYVNAAGTFGGQIDLVLNGALPPSSTLSFTATMPTPTNGYNAVVTGGPTTFNTINVTGDYFTPVNPGTILPNQIFSASWPVTLAGPIQGSGGMRLGGALVVVIFSLFLIL